MKLIYQQMLSFFIVILTTLGIISYAIMEYTEDYAYKQTWSQLESYGENIGDVALKENPRTGNITNITSGFLDDVQHILSQQAVSFAIFDANNNQTYPYHSGKAHLSKGIWKNVKDKGQIVHQTKDSSFKQSKDKGHQMTSVVVPWYLPNGDFVAAIWVGSKVSKIQNSLNEVKQNLMMAFIVAMIIAVILSFILAQYHVSRIENLQQATKKVANKDFDVKIKTNTRGGDEIDDLANDFNGMVKSLDESNTEIKRQEQRRKEFMADASHEMRTPLTTINGILEGLQYDAIPEESKEKSIELMRNETNRLIRLVNENLDYEKIRTNQITLAKHKFDSITPIDNIISQLNQKAEDAKDKLIFRHDDEEVKVYADYDRFIQIMFNIIQNSIQFTNGGKITVLARRMSNDHGAVFSVSDTGIGMTEDQVKNIWDRYYKADDSRKNTKYGESGLGLSIVHQLMKQHGGEVEVESEEGKGTTFILRFYDKGYEKYDDDKKEARD